MAPCSCPPLQMKYLLHWLLQHPLQVPHLDADHEGCGAAHGVQQALGDHGDVGMSPGEGVQESSHGMDTLRQDTVEQAASSDTTAGRREHLSLSSAVSCATLRAF